MCIFFIHIQDHVQDYVCPSLTYTSQLWSCMSFQMYRLVCTHTIPWAQTTVSCVHIALNDLVQLLGTMGYLPHKKVFENLDYFNICFFKMLIMMSIVDSIITQSVVEGKCVIFLACKERLNEYNRSAKNIVFQNANHHPKRVVLHGPLYIFLSIVHSVIRQFLEFLGSHLPCLLRTCISLIVKHSLISS